MATQINRARPKSNVPARKQLTDYESDQVNQIAVWKSRPPNAFVEMFRHATSPGVKLVARVLPDDAVRVAIDRSFE